LVAITILTERVVGAIIMGALVVLGTPTSFALWVALATGSILAAVTAWQLAPPAARAGFRLRRWTNPWAGSGYYGLYSLSTSAQSLDLAVMSAMGGPAVAGIYGAVNRWTQPMGLLVGAFSSASAPFIARSASWKDAWQQVRTASLLPLAAIFTCIAVVFLSPYIVDLLIGPKYQGSVPVLQILAIATIPGIINQPLSVFLQAMGRDRIVALIMSVNVVVALTLIGVLSARFGAVGAAVAALVTQTMVALALIFFAIKARRASEDAQRAPAS
jgi:O-antigen/teichoic acid export membrane protein